MELKRQPDVWRYMSDVWLPCAVDRLSDAPAAVFLAVYVLLRFALERVAPSDLATEHRLHALRLRVRPMPCRSLRCAQSTLIVWPIDARYAALRPEGIHKPC